MATIIIFPKLLTFLYNFCRGFKKFHFSSEIICGQLLETFGNFLLVTLNYHLLMRFDLDRFERFQRVKNEEVINLFSKRSSLYCCSLDKQILGSGCGSVGRAVTSNPRGPRFESSLRQKFIEHLPTIKCIERTKIKEEEAWNGPFFR